MNFSDLSIIWKQYAYTPEGSPNLRGLATAKLSRKIAVERIEFGPSERAIFLALILLCVCVSVSSLKLASTVGSCIFMFLYGIDELMSAFTGAGLGTFAVRIHHYRPLCTLCTNELHRQLAEDGGRESLF